MANVLAVFAHPDDEVLGCGGTLAKHREVGGKKEKIASLILCGRGLHEQARNAGATLGVGTIHTLTYEDQELDGHYVRHLVEEVLKWSNDPDIIYTHHPGDLNTDHALVAKAVLTAFRPKPGEKPRSILACEVLSSTEWTFPYMFEPTWFESLNREQLEKKILAMECYPSEVKPPRDRMGITCSAAYRGNQSGTMWAEAFQLLRRGPM